ncbi:indole-3-pyruvate monooxygenase YUCCA6-like [Solanum tuberosum]|uniref:indole-3-pyruvate monooxygenase YUCCA6-like n=1 Tax=Solanum tuberosum TaxID=4113 RepID=UPI00073A3CC0|nr:PREDICTED: indole-3-pyruvate monooxygenase YUCCA6-like [Solanum tuberosum]
MANFTKEEIGIIVVGAGPSGIAIHVLTREMAYTAMLLLKYLPKSLVDIIPRIDADAIDKIKLGQIKVIFEISEIKEHTVVFDNGDEHQFDAIILAIGCKNIATKWLKVLPGILEIKEHTVVFDNGDEHQFDAIIFATGYKNIVAKWLKDYSSIFLEDGTLINWKGENGLYCAGFSKRGIADISMDARAIADDIKTIRVDQI